MEVKTWKPMENCASCKQAEKLFQQHTRIAAQTNAQTIKRIRELEEEVARLESPVRAARVKAESELTSVKASVAYLAVQKRAEAAEEKLRAAVEFPNVLRARSEEYTYLSETGRALDAAADELEALLKEEGK